MKYFVFSAPVENCLISYTDWLKNRKISLWKTFSRVTSKPDGAQKFMIPYLIWLCNIFFPGLLGQITQTADVSDCPGKCIHALASLICDEVRQDVQCPTQSMRCCVERDGPMAPSGSKTTEKAGSAFTTTQRTPSTTQKKKRRRPTPTTTTAKPKTTATTKKTTTRVRWLRS